MKNIIQMWIIKYSSATQNNFYHHLELWILKIDPKK